MKKIKGQYRQGDLCLHPVADLPAGAKKVSKDSATYRTAFPRGDTTLTLAYGEATGHHHSLMLEDTKDVELYEKDGTLYLRVLEAVPLKHQEHAEIQVKPRTYRIHLQVERWMDEIRRVSD